MIAMVPTAEAGAAPAVTLEQLRGFLGADLPANPGASADPATVLIQLKPVTQ